MTSHDDTRDRFSPETAQRALLAACAEAGVSADDAELFRMGENAIFMLRGEGIVARVARSNDRLPKVERELAVARWLARHGYPAVRVVEEIAPQPVQSDGRLVTFWVLIHESGSASFEDLGALLRDLHALPAPDFALPSSTRSAPSRAAWRIQAAPIRAPWHS